MVLRLLDLEPEFLKAVDAITHQRLGDKIEGADGIMFLCPLCYQKNKGSIGTHSIICWQPHISQDRFPKPGRWSFLGTGLHDLTFRARSSSIHLSGPGCGAHFFIENGNIRMC